VPAGTLSFVCTADHDGEVERFETSATLTSGESATVAVD